MQVLFPKITNVPQFRYTPCFGGVRQSRPEGDIFELTSEVKVKDGIFPVRGTVIKKTDFEDLNGNKVSGYIIRDKRNYDEFRACSGDKVHCMMRIENRPFELYLGALYANKRKEIKGAGTELLKLAAEKSIEYGHDGRVSLLMAGSFPFYYKNNVRVSSKNGNAPEQNAVIDYAVRTGQKPGKFWRASWGTPIAELDEKGASALLKGERLYEKSKSGVLYSKIIENSRHGKTKKYDVDIHFYEDGKNFFLQMIDKNAKRFPQLCSLQGEIRDGKLIPDKKNDEYNLKNGEFEIELKNALSEAQKMYFET